jgi:hypothetical protein
MPRQGDGPSWDLMPHATCGPPDARRGHVPRPVCTDFTLAPEKSRRGGRSRDGTCAVVGLHGRMDDAIRRGKRGVSGTRHCSVVDCTTWHLSCDSGSRTSSSTYRAGGLSWPAASQLLLVLFSQLARSQRPRPRCGPAHSTRALRQS